MEELKMLEFNKPNIASTLNDDGRHGIVTIEPLERGYGITLGNSIRRVLLSSVPGTAVTYIRIDGALHEFSSLNGVREDVTEIVLNVKGIVAKLEGDAAVTGIIDVTGPAVVTDNDIKASSDLTLLNPDHVIATVGDGARFYMELTFEHGRGYVQSNVNKELHPGLSADVIFVDSIFTPVYAVSYNVENTRVGARTDYDKLTIDVTTNGVVDELNTSENNVWNYRKWDSGTLECWARFYINSMNISATSGNLKYSAVSISNPNYPIAFVGNYPTLTITGQVSGGNGWVVGNSTDYSLTSMGSVYAYSSASRTGVGVTVNVMAIGRWK
jgi:hypothetical protein